MKVLITGVAGFLGTHVAEYFTREGWEVYGIDNLTKYELLRTKFDIDKAREHNLNFLKELKVNFRQWDCRDVTAGFILEFWGKMDFIIHCAAQPAMTIAIEDPYYDAENNIISAISMLEVAKKMRIPFVNCSSVHVYGNDTNQDLIEAETRFLGVATDENTPILKGEVTPLHISKIATEFYTSFYAEKYNIRMATFRLTGMYGERQFGGLDHGWVANFAIRTVLDRLVTIYGPKKQVRDALYAEDAARAFKMWFDKGKTGIYNIGGGMRNSISLMECLNKLALLSNKKQTIVYEPKRLGDMWYFVCDYDKAEKDFGWKPEFTNNDGLARLVKWVKENKEIL